MNSQHQQHIGTKRFSVNSDPVAVHRAIVEDGVAIIEGFLSLGQVQKLNSDVDAPLNAFRKQPKPAIADAEKLWMADFVPEHVARVHNLVGFSNVFRQEILNHEFMHEICRLTFMESGDYWLGYGAVIENGPGTTEQKWHRDQPDYALIKQGPDAPEGMLNFFTALTEFNSETGRTQYIWGSNKRVELGKPDADHPVVFVGLKPGDTTIVSGKITHRGSDNLSSDKFRRALALIIVPSVLTPFDATCHLSRKMVETMTPLAQRMVGKRSVMIPAPGTIEARTGIWCLNMKEVGEQMGLKSNQLGKEDE
uniref:Putative oxygenase n=1 Tax=Periglandula ipomoeae TaxID=1037530 RepID=G9FM41_9HYPO|nr:putative oxygenase [Periglandula ipomoeae]